MRWLAFLLVGFSTLSWAETQAERLVENSCREPEMLIVPDGHKASSTHMLQSQQDVEAYIENAQAYLDCLLAAEKAQGEALSFEEKKNSIMRYNLAVARLEGVVESFNQQLRAYKQANAN